MREIERKIIQGKWELAEDPGCNEVDYIHVPERVTVQLDYSQGREVKVGFEDRVIVQKWALMPILRVSLNATGVQKLK